MHVLCAPDSFKETCSASAAAAAMARGVAAAGDTHEADICPIADGGEGTLDALVAALHGISKTVTVTGPRPDRPPITARYGVVMHPHPIAIVELAEAAGLALLAMVDRDPLRTTTHGVGELIRHAIKHDDVGEVILTLGGGATVDAGLGILQALGGQFATNDGSTIDGPVTGGDLVRLASVQIPSGIPPIRIACDVDNPLLGPTGAAAIYGPQKGATHEGVRQLEDGLRHLVSLCATDPSGPGMGAAGGVAYGLSLLEATLCRGAELVLDTVGFDARCAQADLVLTGEGCLDAQSMHGKASMAVAQRARAHGVTPVAVVGTVGEGWKRCVGPDGFERVFDLSSEFSHEAAREHPERFIEKIVRHHVECL